MSKWEVVLLSGSVLVEATDLSISPTGALIFSSPGQIRQVYAPGQWLQVVLKEEARHGYR